MLMPPHDEAGSEKRAAVRAPIDLKVDYKRLNSLFADYTKNISKGGTFVRTGRPLPIGTAFRFSISIPGRSEPFALVGEVAWIREEGPDGGMGIRFIFQDDDRRRDFETIVEGMMVESLGPAIARKLLGK
jgi:type IV pilus assembly protein PilZ